MKICVDYCPFYGFRWFYHAPVCWLCDDQSRKSLGRYSLSMISFDYNWNNLPIVALDWMISIYWYDYNESMMVTIIILVISVNCVTLSEWSLWQSLWMLLCMFHFDYNRNSLVFDMNFMHSCNQSIMMVFDYNKSILITSRFTCNCICYETLLLWFDLILWQLKNRAFLPCFYCILFDLVWFEW